MRANGFRGLFRLRNVSLLSPCRRLRVLPSSVLRRLSVLPHETVREADDYMVS